MRMAYRSYQCDMEWQRTRRMVAFPSPMRSLLCNKQDTHGTDQFVWPLRLLSAGGEITRRNVWVNIGWLDELGADAFPSISLGSDRSKIDNRSSMYD